MNVSIAHLAHRFRSKRSLPTQIGGCTSKHNGPKITMSLWALFLCVSVKLLFHVPLTGHILVLASVSCNGDIFFTLPFESSPSSLDRVSTCRLPEYESAAQARRAGCPRNAASQPRLAGAAITQNIMPPRLLAGVRLAAVLLYAAEGVGGRHAAQTLEGRGCGAGQLGAGVGGWMRSGGAIRALLGQPLAVTAMLGQLLAVAPS